MEKYCKEKEMLIGTKGCDLTAIDPLAVIFTPKTLPAAIQTLLGTDNFYEAIRALIYGTINPVLLGAPTIADDTMTPTDNSEGAVVGTYGAGFSRFIRSGNMTIQFDFPQKFCKAKKMVALNNWNGGCLIITKDYRIVFGNLDNGVYYPLPIVTNYTTPKFVDNKTDVTFNSLIINFGELDNVFPYVTITEVIPELKTLDFEGVIKGEIAELDTTDVIINNHISFKVVDSCTGVDITEATYAYAGVKGVTITVDGAVPTTVTVSNGVINVTDTTTIVAGRHTVVITSGIATGADIDDDICYYAVNQEITL